MSVVHRL